ncbi:hypothetical protein C8R45DRAFT_889673 [Mycena sanguinolenta]|nr:hypothetical protein C8R45DRAFT_889673 [Mycena sanguinolenta]
MSSWPTNHTSPPTLNRKGSAKGKEKATNYPVLEHGTLGAATLVEGNDGRLEWAHITKTPGQESRGRLRSSKPAAVFPATRPPPFQAPRTSITQRAEQGAHFLRAHFPDIDIASELIRDALTEDATIVREFDERDPYAGNVLEPLITAANDAFLAFPMGELSRDLNVSPLVYTDPGGACLHPSAHAIRAFDTPIQQISTSRPNTAAVPTPTYLAVRTFGGTSLLELQTTSSSRVNAEELASLTSSDTGGHQVVDVKLGPASLATDTMTLVNTQGAVYKYDLGPRTTRLVHPTTPPPSSPADAFWRIESTSTAHTCLLMSKTALTELDFRTPSSSSPLDMYTCGGDEILTSVSDWSGFGEDDDDALVRLCTTTQVLWLDRRFALKPVLGFKHGRAFDRSLEARGVFVGDGHRLTALTSRRNGLMTVYDVARARSEHDSAPLVHASPPPYCLSTLPPRRARGITKGAAFLRHPLESPRAPVGYYTLDDVGRITAFRLSYSVDVTVDGEEDAPPSFVWSEDVRRLAAQAAYLREEETTSGARMEEEPTVVDMSDAYEHFFRRRELDDADEAAEAEALYDLVEKAPAFWQDLNEPVENVLTTYDVLLRSSDDPPARNTRADFLADTPVNSTRGYRALAQRRVDGEALGGSAPWARDIGAVLNKFGGRDFACESGQDSASGEADGEEETLDADVRKVADGLRRFDLQGASVRRESEAREQVALDLGLARWVYSPRAFTGKEEGSGREESEQEKDAELESMTKTLSLEDAPPPVRFGFLRPRRQRVEEADDDEQDDGDKNMLPAGVRLLLKDWDVEADPREYVYRDPYAGVEDEPPPVQTRVRRKAEQPATQPRAPPVLQATQTPRAPPVLASSNAPRFMSQDPFPHGSQPVAGPTSLASMSQDVVMASTQVLSGAYGGRAPVKKKVVKKRLGGF